MTLNDKSLVSIIIVNYNGRSFLQKCLKSITEINYKNLEVILVDNNSTDYSLEFVRKNFSKVNIMTLDGNYGYIIDKRKKVNLRRIRSTEELIKMDLITNRRK